MPYAPDNHEAHDYAERIRESLPRRFRTPAPSNALAQQFEGQYLHEAGKEQMCAPYCQQPLSKSLHPLHRS
jgi:hypothetical protein